MVVTMEQVLAVLYPNEPNYENASKLGPEALPFLEQLVKGDNQELAAKATSLASIIQDSGSVSVLTTAAQSKYEAVRVVAAVGSRNLRVAGVDSVLRILNNDKDASIRKHAAKSLNIMRARR
jgi:HEAT repeat protein